MKDIQNKLFIGNLSYDADVSELKELFSAYGTVLEISIPSDRATGRPRGFAFVTMGTEEEAKKALTTDGTEMLGRKIAVNIANSKRQEDNKFRSNDSYSRNGDRRDNMRQRSGGNNDRRGGERKNNSNW